jgi:putative MFS transporter
MDVTPSEEMLRCLDQGRLGWRYWQRFILLALSGAVDFFDFFIVGYLVAVVAPQWHLTYGESSVMLLGGGVGAICGAWLWRPLSEALVHGYTAGCKLDGWRGWFPEVRVAVLR